jgi:hypothetical protein
MTSRLLLVLPVIALLAACAPTGGTTGGGDTGGGDSSGGDSSASGDCSAFGDEYAPFTSDLIASQSGTTWGDGSEFAIQLSDDAIAAGILPQVEFLSNVNGGVQTASSQIFDEVGDGAYSNSLNLFDSQFDGQPGIARVFAIDDQALPGERYDGDSLLLGDYCIALEVE